MEYDADAHRLLGYGQMDLQVGDWLTCNDVATFTSVRYPEQDGKYYVRELLRILGKRFSGIEAGLIWNQVEQYRDNLANLFGPPEGASGRLEFGLAATEWYAQYGLKFEKEWHLAAPFELQFARVGHERFGRHWLGLLHHDLVYFSEAGFSSLEILAALRKLRGRGLLGALVYLRTTNEVGKVRFWVEISAWLTGFALTEEQVTAALAEITIHAGRLGIQQGYPVNPVKATLDYFQRLEFGGLGPEVIGL
jgi:hypothetical protein